MINREREVDAGRAPEAADLPAEIERNITNKLAEFSRRQGFELKALYHDRSLWLLLRDRDSLTERIQIGAYGVSPFLELRFMPDAYIIDAGTLRTRAVVPESAIQRIAYHELFNTKELGPRIDECLSAAQKELESITRSELTTELPLAQRNQ